jgi:hypothetical protein
MQTVPMTEFILISSNIFYLVFSLTVSSISDVRAREISVSERQRKGQH